MGWTIATIILIITVTIMSFALINLLKKNEALEDFITKQSEAVNECDKRLKEIDNKIKLESNSIPPPKKKRGRKRTKKRYFTEDTELAIAEYLNSNNQKERDYIYNTRIHYPFYKLAENLIHTFKFYYTEVDDLNALLPLSGLK